MMTAIAAGLIAYRKVFALPLCTVLPPVRFGCCELPPTFSGIICSRGVTCGDGRILTAAAAVFLRTPRFPWLAAATRRRSWQVTGYFSNNVHQDKRYKEREQGSPLTWRNARMMKPV